MRAVIVTPEVFVADRIKTALAEKNLICDATPIGEDGLEIEKLCDYDVILLDLTLLDIDGEVQRRLRAARMREQMPIRSGLVELDDTIKGLGLGSKEPLTESFARRELVSRIRAIVRRASGHSESTVQTGKLRINLDTPSFRSRTSRCTLPPKSTAFLRCSACERARP